MPIAIATSLIVCFFFLFCLWRRHENKALRTPVQTPVVTVVAGQGAMRRSPQGSRTASPEQVQVQLAHDRTDSFQQHSEALSGFMAGFQWMYAVEAAAEAKDDDGELGRGLTPVVWQSRLEAILSPEVLKAKRGIRAERPLGKGYTSPKMARRRAEKPGDGRDLPLGPGCTPVSKTLTPTSSAGGAWPEMVRREPRRLDFTTCPDAGERDATVRRPPTAKRLPFEREGQATRSTETSSRQASASAADGSERVSANQNTLSRMRNARRQSMTMSVDRHGGRTCDEAKEEEDGLPV